MSIINEALKKAASGMSPSPTPNISPAPQPSLEHTSHSVRLWVTLGAIGAALGSCVLVLLLSLGFKNTVTITPEKISARHKPVAPPEQQARFDTVTREIRHDLDDWRLSGVVEVDDEQWAIINDEILCLGDTYQNARVTHIDANAVVLEDESGEIKLRIK